MKKRFSPSLSTFSFIFTTVLNELIWFQSLGCLLYALCFYKSPFDIVYERGDSVALATVSGKIHIPAMHPFSEVILNVKVFLLGIFVLDLVFFSVYLSILNCSTGQRRWGYKSEHPIILNFLKVSPPAGSLRSRLVLVWDLRNEEEL